MTKNVTINKKFRMQKLIGNEIATAKEISNLNRNSIFNMDPYYLCKTELWPVFFDFNPIFDRFAGGVDGRLIAYYKRGINHGANHVDLYDHQMNLVESIKLDITIKDAWIYITSNDYLVVLSQLHKGITISTYYHSTLNQCVKVPTHPDERILGAYFWDTGAVFVTGNNDVWYMDKFKDPVLLFTVEVDDSLSKIVAIPASNSTTNQPIVYLAGNEDEIYVGTGNSYHKVQMPGNVTHMALHKSNQFIAFLIDGAKLSICESNLKTGANTDLESGKLVTSFGWINDMVIIGYENEVVVCPYDSIPEQWDLEGGEPVIFSNSSHALIFTSMKVYDLAIVSEKLLEATRSLFPVSSFKLIKALRENNPREVDALMTNGQLEGAIRDCIESAKHIIADTKIQKTFILAAAFGKSFMDPDRDGCLAEINDEIVKTVKLLRLMNFVHSKLQLAMNTSEIDELFYSSIIPLKFCNRGEYGLAHEISEFMQTPETPVLTDWCSCIIRQIEDDNECFEIIKSRMSPAFDPTAVAIAASHLGRSELANKISELETYPKRLVEFFLTIKNYKGALTAALRSMDSKIFLSVISKIIENEGKSAVQIIAQFMKYNPAGLSLISGMIDFGRDEGLSEIFDEVEATDTKIEISLKKIIQQLIDNQTIPFYEDTGKSLKQMKKDYPKNNLIASTFYMEEKMLHCKEGCKKMASEVDIEGKITEMPINKVIEKVILHTHSIDKALEIASKSKVKDKRSHVIIARVIMLNKIQKLYSEIPRKCPEAVRMCIAMLVSYRDKEGIRDIIGGIPDEKERNAVAEEFNTNQDAFSFMNLNDEFLSKRILLETPIIGE